jgi:hypothetical protein
VSDEAASWISYADDLESWRDRLAAAARDLRAEAENWREVLEEEADVVIAAAQKLAEASTSVRRAAREAESEGIARGATMHTYAVIFLNGNEEKLGRSEMITPRTIRPGQVLRVRRDLHEMQGFDWFVERVDEDTEPPTVVCVESLLA